MIVKFKINNHSCNKTVKNSDIVDEKIVDNIIYKKIVDVRKVSSGQHGVHVWTHSNRNYFLSFYDAYDVRIEE